MKVNELKFYEKNPRKISKEDLEKLAKSIKGFEKMLTIRKIIIDENNVIIGGNQRVKALKQLGYKEIKDEWIDKREDLTEDEKKEFVIKDNAPVGGGWDWDILADWDADDLGDWGLDIPEIEVLENEAKEDNFEIPKEIKTDIVKGDIFEFKKDGKVLHRLMCGDSTDSDNVAKLMNGEKADCVITDPPYNILDHKIETGINTDDLFSLIYSLLPENSFCSFFGQHPTVFDFLTSAYKFQFKYKNEIIWSKLLPSNIFQDLLRTHENCFVLQKGKLNFYSYHVSYDDWMEENFIIKAESIKRELSYWKSKANGGNQKSIKDTKRKGADEYYDYMGGEHQNLGVDKKRIQSVWHIYRDSQSKKQKGNSLHVTQKPIEFLSRLVKMTSKENMLILDLFLGSGSTMVASHQLNRKCYGLELNEKYCQIIIDRMQKLDEKLEIIKI